MEPPKRVADEDKFSESLPRLNRTNSSAGNTTASKRARSKNRQRVRSKSQDEPGSILAEIMVANRDASIQKQSVAIRELSSCNLSWEICHFNHPGYRRTYLCWKLRQGAPSPFNSAMVQLYAAENARDDPKSPKAPTSASRSGTVGRKKVDTHSSDEKTFWAGRTKELRRSFSANKNTQKILCPLEIAFLDSQGKRMWRLPLVLVQGVTVFDEENGAVQLEISLSGRRSSKPRIAEIQDSFDHQKLRYTSSTVELFFEKDAERDSFGALISEMMRNVKGREPDGYLMEELVRIESWLTPRLVDGQICLHKGNVRFKVGLRWQKKFIALFRTKLIVLEDQDSDHPSIIINLEGSLVRGRTTNDKVFSIRYPEKEDKFVFGTLKSEDRTIWLVAFDKRTSVEFGATITGHELVNPASGGLKMNELLSFEDDDKEDEWDDGSTQDLELSSHSSAPPKALKPASSALQSAPPSLGRANTIGSTRRPDRASIRTSISTPQNDFSYDPLLYQEDPVKFYSDELDALMLKSQKNFFEYLHDKLSLCKTPISSSVESFQEWVKASKASFTNRGRRTKVVDTYLEIYCEAVERSMHLVKHAYLFCFDDIYHAGNSQISFSFPGFDSQIFNVGQCGLVPVWNCFKFASEVVSFQEEDWTGSLLSMSPAKELMQYSPDLSNLNSGDRRKTIQIVSSTAALEQLRSLVLASYLAANVDMIALEQLELFTFQDAKTFGELVNKVNLDVFVDTKYAFNPRAKIIQEYVYVGNYDRFEPDKVIEDLTNSKDGAPPYKAPNLDFDMVIADNMYWLKLFRLAIEERFKALQDLKAAIDWWKCSHEREKTKKRVESVEALLKGVEVEEKDLVELMYLLPSRKALDSPDLLSEVLLLQRKQIEEAFALEVTAQQGRAKLSAAEEVAVATVRKLREKTRTRRLLGSSAAVEKDSSKQSLVQMWGKQSVEGQGSEETKQ